MTPSQLALAQTLAMECWIQRRQMLALAEATPYTTHVQIKILRAQVENARGLVDSLDAMARRVAA